MCNHSSLASRTSSFNEHRTIFACFPQIHIPDVDSVQQFTQTTLKTFKRAELELKNFWRCMLHPSVQDLFSTHGITWKYIVEKGAWWGGFWERHFRTIKTCLRKIIGRSSLSLNELETVFIEIEAMINSRPITYIYDDPSEPSPLTPAHFLIGKRLLSLPVTRVSREDLTGSRLSLLKRYNISKIY
ncbi:integrase catalytic domain-containing protein [Trichonephila clavata]|uniref:Integrase catalytic domain-containing protein n=1 Tax=Trichonephila clavata TaxID=2740835 RepID=A0A8X6GJ29_TRICU|nr:integrase catalytic domain-containing protein [Trichonephila clavata]